MSATVVVYNSSLEKVAVLENAHNVGYKKAFNQVWTAQFTLPADDAKNSECTGRTYVEIYENGERVDLFRIIDHNAKTSAYDMPAIVYDCEHVLATLIDDVMFQYHQTDNQTTTYNLNYILGNQTTTRWQLGTCDFTTQFSYTWENENLLGAILSVTDPIVDEYMWTWDTSSYPWTLNLVQLADVMSADKQIRYRKNLKGIERVMDYSQLCTRVYPLGQGEGVNQLTIEEAADNTSGNPYIDTDVPYTDVVSHIVVDTTIEDVDTLYYTGLAYLEKTQYPKATYTVETADLHPISLSDTDALEIGDGIRVIDEDFGIDILSRVISITKPDLTGAPGDMTVEISNSADNLGDDFTQLAERSRIYEVYAQGATNVYQVQTYENCDASHPLHMRFRLPEDIARVNSVLLSFNIENFRAYATGAAAGGSHSHGLNLWYYDSNYDVYLLGMQDRGSGNIVLTEATGGPSAATTESSTTHTHDTVYGIYEETASSPSVTVKVGVNGGTLTEITGSPFTADQTELDITDYVSADGQWYDVEFTPDQNLRIEANLHLQVFIKSN